MVDAASLRDSTQIVLPKSVLADYREELEERFVVSVLEEGDTMRIVGSPVVIRNVSDYLCRQGINVP